VWSNHTLEVETWHIYYRLACSWAPVLRYLYISGSASEGRGTLLSHAQWGVWHAAIDITCTVRGVACCYHMHSGGVACCYHMHSGGVACCYHMHVSEGCGMFYHSGGVALWHSRYHLRCCLALWYWYWHEQDSDEVGHVSVENNLLLYEGWWGVWPR